MHVSVSMRARLFSTVIDWVGQVFAHFWQPMQPTLHTLRVLAPAMVFLHVTTEAVGDEAWSTIEMMPRGHIFAHVPQPVQAAVAVSAHLSEDGKVRPAGPPHFPDNPPSEAEAVFHAAAIAVGAPVVYVVEKAGQQITIGVVNLHAVKTGPAAQHGGIAVLSYNLIQLFQREVGGQLGGVAVYVSGAFLPPWLSWATIFPPAAWTRQAVSWSRPRSVWSSNTVCPWSERCWRSTLM